MISRQQKLARATRILGKYYGIHSTKELAERITLDSVRDSNPNGSLNSSVVRPTEAEGRLIETLIDTSEGALFTKTFIDTVIVSYQDSESTQGNGRDLVNDVARILQMHYEPGQNFAFRNPAQNVNPTIQERFATDGGTTEVGNVGVRQMLGYSAPGGDSNVRINSTPHQPTKQAPGLSIYLFNSKRVTLESQNIDAATIFLNGIPNVELQRAVPFVNIEFFFPRGPKSAITEQLQNLSLNKFLLGGVKPQANSALDTMVEADTVQGTEISSRNPTPDSPIPDRYSRAGMELFTAPQTLVNADDNADSSIRANPILDKFRPLMTLEDLTITVEPTRGLMSFKRGTLSIRLHDRSRLPEIAEFVRADLYGTNRNHDRIWLVTS